MRQLLINTVCRIYNKKLSSSIIMDFALVLNVHKIPPRDQFDTSLAFTQVLDLYLYKQVFYIRCFEVLYMFYIPLKTIIHTINLLDNAHNRHKYYHNYIGTIY